MIANASSGEVILAIRLRQFGDVLATLGALEALKRRWPQRRIVYVVDDAFIPILEPVSFIDELFVGRTYSSHVPQTKKFI